MSATKKINGFSVAPYDLGERTFTLVNGRHVSETVVSEHVQKAVQNSLLLFDMP